MSHQYTRVSEATTHTAFLEFPCGYELATLHRVMPDEVASSNHDKEHTASCLTDEQWQAVIDLVNAAPELLEALTDILAAYHGLTLGRQNTEWEGKFKVKARAAIAKAKGSK